MSDAVLSQFRQEVKIDASPASGRKIKVGIIGTGGISEGHIENYLKMPDIEIVAACDLVPTKAASVMHDYHGVKNCRCYMNHKEMIDNEPELDMVSICTYNAQHAEPAIYALEHGLHVILEKPFTVTLDEAIEVMKAEKRSGKILSIGFQPRYDYSMQMVRDIVRSGKLGKVYYVQTGGGRRRGIPGGTFIEKSTGGIGALGDIGCYALDMVMNALGHPKPLTVSGYTSDFFGKRPQFNEFPEDAERFSVDDFGAAFIRLEGGIIIDFRISWAMHADTPGDTIILGTEGALRIPSCDCWNGTIEPGIKLYHDVCGQQTETPLPYIPKGEPTLFYRKLRGVIDRAFYGKEDAMIVPSSEIIYNQAILDAIVKSAALGREVEVVIPEV